MKTENGFTRGLFRTSSEEFSDGTVEVSHHCVVCGFTFKIAIPLEPEMENINRQIGETKLAIETHQSEHPAEKLNCDWSKFKEDFHRGAIADPILRIHVGVDILRWKN